MLTTLACTVALMSVAVPESPEKPPTQGLLVVDLDLLGTRGGPGSEPAAVLGLDTRVTGGRARGGLTLQTALRVGGGADGLHFAVGPLGIGPALAFARYTYLSLSPIIGVDRQGDGVPAAFYGGGQLVLDTRLLGGAHRAHRAPTYSVQRASSVVRRRRWASQVMRSPSMQTTDQLLGLQGTSSTG